MEPERARISAEIRHASIAVAACGLVYALYRAYYGFGGTVGMIGTPASQSSWRATNLGGAAVLLLIALLPLVALPLWQRPRWRRSLLAVAWLVAVGGVMHALVMDVQRVASLAGWHHIRYPAAHWLSQDSHPADLQDLFFNETWFLAEGLLWSVLAWAVLRDARDRRRWFASAGAGVGAATGVGLLSAFGVIGRFLVH
jgi:hypothetical protein